MVGMMVMITGVQLTLWSFILLVGVGRITGNYRHQEVFTFEFFSAPPFLSPSLPS